MKTINVLAGSLLLMGSSTACFSDKEPAAQYRLSKEQLAWQGYHQGEVLRFGHAQNSQVRTYRITEVRDHMEEQYVQAGWLPLPQKAAPFCQHLTVTAQRTDSIYSPLRVLDLELLLDQGTYDHPVLRAKAEWEHFFYGRLPIDEVNQGAQIDTTSYQYPGTIFLSSATLGPATYAQVLHLANRYPYGPAPTGSRPTRHLYYARGKGVVAYEEAGTGLWYRLP